MVVVSSHKVMKVSRMLVTVISSDIRNSIFGDMVVVYEVHYCLLGSFKVVTAVVGVTDFNQLLFFIGNSVCCGCDSKLRLLIAVVCCFNDRLQFVWCQSAASFCRR